MSGIRSLFVMAAALLMTFMITVPTFAVDGPPAPSPNPTIERMWVRCPAASARVGDTVRVYVRGTPGARATFDVAHVQNGIPMSEAQPGQYVGSFMVPNISADHLHVRAHLWLGGQDARMGADVAMANPPISPQADGDEAQLGPAPGATNPSTQPPAGGYAGVPPSGNANVDMPPGDPNAPPVNGAPGPNDANAQPGYGSPPQNGYGTPPPPGYGAPPVDPNRSAAPDDEVEPPGDQGPAPDAPTPYTPTPNGPPPPAAPGYGNPPPGYGTPPPATPGYGAPPYGASPTVPPGYRPPASAYPMELFINVLSPNASQRVGSDFAVTGCTLPYAQVQVFAHLEQSIIPGVITIGKERQHAVAMADANGNFSVPMHWTAGGNSIRLRVIAIDPHTSRSRIVEFSVGRRRRDQ